MKSIVAINAKFEAFSKREGFKLRTIAFLGFLLMAFELLISLTVVPEEFLNSHWKLLSSVFVLTALGPAAYCLLVAEAEYVLGLLSRMSLRYDEYVASGIQKHTAFVFVLHGLIVHLLLVSSIIVLLLYGNKPVTYIFAIATALYDFKFHKYKL